MEIVQKPTQHKSSRGIHRPTMIVIHGDAGRTDLGTISWIASPGSRVSYHYLIGRDGTVYQFVADTSKAWHAGESEWRGESDLNRVSIGVCLANNGSGMEPYKPVQYGVAGRLVADLCRKHRIPCDMIRGHYEVSPGRKADPWPWFAWDKFYTHFGMWSGGRYDA